MTPFAKIARAKFVKHSICPCGFPILADHIPVGEMYIVYPDMRAPLNLFCGGCHKTIENIPGIFVAGRSGGGRAGYLPAEIFEIDEGSVPSEN